MSADPKFPKSIIQTMLEKLTDTELAEFEKFLNKPTGNAAKVWVLKDAIGHVSKQRNSKPKKAATSEAELVAHFTHLRKSDEISSLEFASMVKNPFTKKADPLFLNAVKAIHGINEFFGDESEKAIRTRDKKFFRAALDALETTHRMPDANPKNIYTRRIHHVLATLRIKYKMEAGTLSIKTIGEFNQAMVDLVEDAGVKPFDDLSVLHGIRDECGIEELPQDYPGRSTINYGFKD